MATRFPANTIVLRSADLTRNGTASATRALNETSGSIDLDQAVGNEFQPNLLFRGFEASPLAGDAQGLAVYVNGSRFNSSFADATNWDVIPDIAISELDVVGSSPAFGLNALGGAVSVRLKTDLPRRAASSKYRADRSARSRYPASTAYNRATRRPTWRSPAPIATAGARIRPRR
ncbi:MAG: Plug domain-containing protein [Rhodospirillales bacterium]